MVGGGDVVVKVSTVDWYGTLVLYWYGTPTLDIGLYT